MLPQQNVSFPKTCFFPQNCKTYRPSLFPRPLCFSGWMPPVSRGRSLKDAFLGSGETENGEKRSSEVKGTFRKKEAANKCLRQGLSLRLGAGVNRVEAAQAMCKTIFGFVQI